MEKLGIAIGRNTYTLVWYASSEPQEKELVATQIVKEVANTHEGVADVLNFEPEVLVVVGNKEWGKAFMFALHEACPRCVIRYVPKPSKKGSRENLPKFLAAVLQSGITGASFFAERKPKQEGDTEDPHPHAWYRMSHEYVTATDQVRRAKHLVLSTMAVLFPEAIRPSQDEIRKGRPMQNPLPPNIWTGKMKKVLQNPDPFSLQEDASVPEAVRTHAKTSLGRSVPREKREHYMKLHREYYANLLQWLKTQEEVLGRLSEAVGGHPMMQIDPKSVTLTVLCGFIGWREWSWRELQSFCGLAVTRVDERGKPRISRMRKPIRNYLYLIATLTKWGKELVATKDGKLLDPPLKTRVKRIEGLLGALRRRYLMPKEIPQAA